MKAKPFVKWVGGKTQLLTELKTNKPQDFSRYIEPFVGGGAFLFNLDFDGEKIINDSNEELINCYITIKDNVDELIEHLKIHKNDKDYFYEIRAVDTTNLNNVERASRFIYLNRTCFNGLWRVNKSNKFNTPFGNYKNPKIVNEELLKSVSKVLQNVTILNMNYLEFIEKFAKERDFIYFDPPYHPVSKYSDFNRYTKDFFTESDQKELANLFRKLHEKGCKLMLSNSYSDLILNIYSDFDIVTVSARRNINKNGDGRGKINEVLIKNYES